jgi:predicted helicase
VRVLALKPNHKRIAAYHDSLVEFGKLAVKHESAVRAAFQALLEECTALVNKGREDKWKLVPEFSLKTKSGAKITPDGVLLDTFRLVHGVWEAKDTSDDLDKEIKAKFKLGYPRTNILFQAPQRAVLVQDGERVLDVDLANAIGLVEILKQFFEYQPREFDQWEKAVGEFKERLPEIGRALTDIVRREEKKNAKFAEAFEQFVTLCRQSLNPNLRKEAVEEMLVQHLLTERIFRRIFGAPDFMQRNNIAQEIERVVAALTSRAFSRDAFLKELNRFYKAIEDAADTIPEFSEKQKFLNTVYEQFFQGFAVKRADTLGIVYTPQEIVDFMLASVEEILRKDFGRELGDRNVHIIDPFVGTGNFMVNLMRRLPKTQLEYKYREELHCNEVMLLPYYVATMNIEHTFLEQIGKYEPFPGVCLVDTFETAEKEQHEFPFFNPENTERVKRQKTAPIFVVIGNPPYNAWQQDENDNNKNRKYPEIDRRVRLTYSNDSRAILKNSLADPYVKAFRFASDRIGDEGIVCYVSNNGFIDGIAADGMRKHLAEDFDLIYVLDLGGNVRRHPKLSGTTHNVFGIQVGVSISVLVRLRRRPGKRAPKIRYHALPVDWRREEKEAFLQKTQSVQAISWGKPITPDQRYNWLAKRSEGEFAEFIAIANKGGRNIEAETVFRTCLPGIATKRDEVVFDFNAKALAERCRAFADAFNAEIQRLDEARKKSRKPIAIDDFVDTSFIKWSSTLKLRLERGEELHFREDCIRQSLYRPFTKKFLCYQEGFVDRPSSYNEVIAGPTENRLLCVNVSPERPFVAIMTNILPESVVTAGFGSFSYALPLFFSSTGSKHDNGNIRRSAIDRFVIHYDAQITREDIFYYIYAVLHHPEYRERYAENLKRELPRIPFIGKEAKALVDLAEIGRKLAELHVNYEDAAEYKLKRMENRDEKLNWRVEKMRLTKDKRAIVYNEFLTLDGIPPETFNYRLGNRSALEWVIDQYQVSTDKRSRITNDPNRGDEPDYIVKLIGKVITVSLETQKLVAKLPPIEIATTQ